MISKIAYLLAAFSLFLCTSCAMIQKSDAMDTERTLAAAGFQMKFAKTPEQIAKVTALPQRKLTPTPGPNGGNHFVWADAKYCKCIYAGTDAAYGRFQKLSINKQIAANEQAASMNWGAWGGWGPWY